jgi:hypothetical protein
MKCGLVYWKKLMPSIFIFSSNLTSINLIYYEIKLNIDFIFYRCYGSYDSLNSGNGSVKIIFIENIIKNIY